MTAPASPKATQGQGELKRALVDRLAEIGRRLNSAEPLADLLPEMHWMHRLLSRLAAGSPEVIEAMVDASWDNDEARSPEDAMSAALAAGMKVIAEGGK